MNTLRTAMMLAMCFASFYFMSYLQKEMISGEFYESSILLLLVYFLGAAVSMIIPYYVCNFIAFVLGYIKRIF
jgi:hypothetical protein